jgi:MFS family permease
MAAIVDRFTGLALFRSLANRSFTLLWAGQTFSRVGDFLYDIALAWWVLQKTGSAAAMAGVLIFAFTPMLVFLLIGGVAVDRYNRLRLMLVSDLARGVVVSVVALLAFTGALDIWHVYVAALVFGLVDAFFQPAYTATVPEIVAADDLPSANSLSSMSVQLGRILGPALGAGIIAIGGSALAFAINASTFFISAAFLIPLQGLAVARASAEGDAEVRTSPLADLREGIATVLRTPWLWISIVVYALTNVTLTGPYSVAMPFLVRDYMHAGVDTLGLLYASFPVGYILGGVWLGRKTRIHRRGWLIFAGVVVAAVMLLLFGLPLPVAVLMLAAVVNGAALEVGSLAWTNSLQEFVPSDKLGRVSSIDMLGSFVLMPIGFGITGWATDIVGPAPIFVIGGGATALIGLLALTHPAIRKLD